MKIFIYKTLIVFIAIYVLFQLTVGLSIKKYESKVEELFYSKQGREQILDKVKSEIKSANEKENLFTNEEKELLSNFINKVQEELSINGSQ